MGKYCSLREKNIKRKEDSIINSDLPKPNERERGVTIEYLDEIKPN